VNGLSVLPQVVESRKPSIAVALERALSSMFSDMPGQMLTSGETEIARWISSAEKALTLLLERCGISIACLSTVIRTILVFFVDVHRFRHSIITVVPVQRILFVDISIYFRM
jgi:hypothetical protein